MKKIVLTILLSFLFFASKAQVGVAGYIQPLGGGSYPTNIDTFAYGGFSVVADTFQRNRITTQRRAIGMEVYCVADGNTYQLIGGTANSNWSAITFSRYVPYVGATKNLNLGTNSLYTDSIKWTQYVASSNFQTAILFADSAGYYQTDVSYLVWDENNKRLGLNEQGATPSATLEVRAPNLNVPVAQFTQLSTTNSSTAGSILKLTDDPSAAMLNLSRLGSLQFAGAVNTTHTLQNGANISASATENWSPTANGTQLTFSTTPNGSVTRSSALTLNSDQTATFFGNISGAPNVFYTNDTSGGAGTIPILITTADLNASGSRYVKINNYIYYFDTTQKNLPLGNFNIGIGKTLSATNAIVGNNADTALTTAINVAAFGTNALAKNRSGSDEVAVGFNALAVDTGASQSTAVGSGALAVYAGISLHDNEAFGYHALTACTLGLSNVALGFNTLAALTSGNNNVAVGNSACLKGNGSNNTAIGSAALGSSSFNGSSSTVIGSNAGLNVTGGSTNNTFVGFAAGDSITTGQFNTIIGEYNGVVAKTSNNNVIIADGAQNIRVYWPSNGNTILGNTTADNGSSLQVNGTITSTAPTYSSGGYNPLVINSGSGQYQIVSNGIVAFKSNTTATGNTSISIPAGAMLLSITIIPVGNETVSAGTSGSTSTNLINAQAVTAGTPFSVSFGNHYYTATTTLSYSGAVGSVNYIVYYQ